MISAYDHAINDDPLVRAYLAIAMGATGDQFYGNELVEGLEDEARESRLAAIQAVGMVGSENAVMKLIDIINNSDHQDERLAATMSLGFIGDDRSIPKLNELLEDDEPNIRWDAAIALAKMGEDSSVPVIETLMDRDYLMTFPELDNKEINKVLLTAIETSSVIRDDRFEPRLAELATADENLTIRDAAIKTLKRSYDRII
jgi:HEAT repeat protein